MTAMAESLHIRPGRWAARAPAEFANAMKALAASGVFHLAAAAALVVFAWSLDAPTAAPPAEPVVVDVRVPAAEPAINLENDDIGRDPGKPTNFNVDRIETVSVPGAVRPDQPVGIDGAPVAPPQTLPPPPGLGRGQGGGRDAELPGQGQPFGEVGGFVDGRFAPGQVFGGRSGATREKMVAEGGGSKESEAAVARGLAWLKRQQKPDGRWTLVGGDVEDDYAATGLALLPFLAAGYTHRGDPALPDSKEYTRTVDSGLRWLVNKQQNNGLLGSHTTFKHYSHAIASMALCEAFGMTRGDAVLRRPAQRAIDYLVKSQHAGGGFRYMPNQPGDTSVTAWCLQALESGRSAGLAVPREALDRVTTFLDALQSERGAAYGYVRPNDRPALNLDAAGLLCRAYLGWGPRNPGMLAGVDKLKRNLPATDRGEIYYHYYATQVMHFCGTPDDWAKVWNPAMRDLLVATQDASTTPNRGSWPVDRSNWSRSGGRLYQTSLSLLTLEVYYRRLPLYHRERGGPKESD
jgi:hypothetical protein